MSEISDYEVADAMERYGGGFIAALGRCSMLADGRNLSALKAAFPIYWETYREIAYLHRARSAKQAESGAA